MTILGKVLHSMTSVLQIPVVIILILFIAAILVAIGWIISEYMNEHKHMQVQLPKLLDSQMQSFLSLQNRVFSTIIEVISVNIVLL